MVDPDGAYRVMPARAVDLDNVRNWNCGDRGSNLKKLPSWTDKSPQQLRGYYVPAY